MSDWTTRDYREEVKVIAMEAVEAYPDDEDERQQSVTESVDGSCFIMYYSANETVLQASDNEPDGSEVREMCKADADWRELRMVAAYLAMEADVMEEVARLIEEREEVIETAS